MPTKPRELGAVDKVLLEAFRGLAAGTQPWPLFVTGRPGRGKTCAALAFLDHTTSGIYLTTHELVERRMQSFGNNANPMNWDFHFDPKQRALVVLDELGVRKQVNDTHYECVQRALDMREGFGLVLVSNKSLAEIEELYDDRIASRCAAGTVVELKGIDHRTD